MVDNEKFKQDYFLLSPYQLLNKHGAFPWALVIHLALLVLTTAEILLIITNETESTRLQEHLFYNLFLEESNKADVEDFNRNVYLYTVNEIKEHIGKSIEVDKFFILELL
jgi:hypothetical protein